MLLTRNSSLLRMPFSLWFKMLGCLRTICSASSMEHCNASARKSRLLSMLSAVLNKTLGCFFSIWLAASVIRKPNPTRRSTPAFKRRVLTSAHGPLTSNDAFKPLLRKKSALLDRLPRDLPRTAGCVVSNWATLSPPVASLSRKAVFFLRLFSRL